MNSQAKLEDSFSFQFFLSLPLCYLFSKKQRTFNEVFLPFPIQILDFDDKTTKFQIQLWLRATMIATSETE